MLASARTGLYSNTRTPARDRCRAEAVAELAGVHERRPGPRPQPAEKQRRVQLRPDLRLVEQLRVVSEPAGELGLVVEVRELVLLYRHDQIAGRLRIRRRSPSRSMSCGQRVVVALARAVRSARAHPETGSSRCRARGSATIARSRRFVRSRPCRSASPRAPLRSDQAAAPWRTAPPTARCSRRRRCRGRRPRRRRAADAGRGRAACRPERPRRGVGKGGPVLSARRTVGPRRRQAAILTPEAPPSEIFRSPAARTTDRAYGVHADATRTGGGWRTGRSGLRSGHERAPDQSTKPRAAGGADRRRRRRRAGGRLRASSIRRRPSAAEASYPVRGVRVPPTRCGRAVLVGRGGQVSAGTAGRRRWRRGTA